MYDVYMYIYIYMYTVYIYRHIYIFMADTFPIIVLSPNIETVASSLYVNRTLWALKVSFTGSVAEVQG